MKSPDDIIRIEKFETCGKEFTKFIRRDGGVFMFGKLPNEFWEGKEVLNDKMDEQVKKWEQLYNKISNQLEILLDKETND